MNVTDEDLDKLESEVRNRVQNIVICAEMSVNYPLMTGRLMVLVIREALTIVQTVHRFNLAHRTGGDGHGHQ